MGNTLTRNVWFMKYDAIRKGAIYTFIGVTVAMTLLGVFAIWFPDLDDVVGKAFATILVVGFGCVVIAYAASLLERGLNGGVSHTTTFAPQAHQPVPKPNHIAGNQ